MPTRLRRLIAPTDTEAQQLGKLVEAVVPTLDSDIRRQVVQVAGEVAGTTEAKWRRAVTEGLAGVHDRVGALAKQVGTPVIPDAEDIPYHDVTFPTVQAALDHLLSTPGGGGAPTQFVWDQGVPASVWDITHSLGGYPAVIVVDSANNTGIGEVRYLNPSRLTVTFSAGFSGKAYLVL